MNLLSSTKQQENRRITSFFQLYSSFPARPLSATTTSFFATSDYAVVSQTIAPGYLGRIYYQGTYWFGCTTATVEISEGAKVEVLSRHGTTWLVRPIR
ncbi:MAG: hypothetical protein F6K30_18645 [Cyanothece sp. SIO2G6]|nr:hypothetical protein [Cyanothece sp. SIO2G6]